MTDFILISGVGIYRKEDIKEVRPSFEEMYNIEVVPPKTSEEEFVFKFIKETEIYLEIVRVPTNSKAKDEELNRDVNSLAVIRDVQTLTYSEVETKLFNNDSDALGKLPVSVKNYVKRLVKNEEYLTKVSSIQSNPNAPDYHSLLSSVQQFAPSREDMDKQAKSLSKIHDAVSEQLDSILEKSEEESDEELEFPLLDYFDSPESVEHIQSKVTTLLKQFYDRNFSEFAGFEEPGDEFDTEDNEPDVEGDALNAERILESDDTVRNILEDDSEDEDKEEKPRLKL